MCNCSNFNSLTAYWRNNRELISAQKGSEFYFERHYIPYKTGDSEAAQSQILFEITYIQFGSTNNDTETFHCNGIGIVS